MQSSWTESLAQGIRQGLLTKQPCRIVVHTPTQAEIGKRAVARLVAEIRGSKADYVTFHIPSDTEKDAHSIGELLVP